MRFPRNVKIFRGQIDAAPFAGLFFMLVLFTMLFGTHVFIPGVRVSLQAHPEVAPLESRTVQVTPAGTIRYDGQAYDFASFEAHFREQHKTATLPPRLILDPAPGADKALNERVESLLKELGVGVKVPGLRLELPENAGFPGSPNPIVIVSVNRNGQIFYQHQRSTDTVLHEKLALAAEKSPFPLTMVLQADKDVPFNTIDRLCGIARKAGITEVLFAHRPPISPE